LADTPHPDFEQIYQPAFASYTERMESTSSKPRQVGILILDEDAQSAAGIRQLLDSEGWRVDIVADANALLDELRSGEWALVVANIAMTGVDSAAYITLQELASVDPEEGGRVRVLYIVPEMTGSKYLKSLEQARLPYVARPFHFHDFLEKVSDLLFEVHAIDAPLRQVSYELGEIRKKKTEANRDNSMFATRDGYSYTEEEVAEYERQESALSTRHKPRTNLGDPKA
jgi:PleD family two-component response regulator